MSTKQRRISESPKTSFIDSAIYRRVLRLVEQNRGRDMSSLFITCRDIFLEDRYDLSLRLHTKKSPQVAEGRSLVFKRHLIENLVNSPGYTENVIRLFEENPQIGLAIAPIIHFSYATLGRSWFANKPKAEEIIKVLGIKTLVDEDTPVAPYGTMYWFRPKALRKVFAHNWRWEDFDEEPYHVDGGLAHALERVLGYAAMDAGYTVQHIMSPDQASQNYSMLEYKLQRLLALVPNRHFYELEKVLLEWSGMGHPMNPLLPPNITIKESLKTLSGAVKRSIRHRIFRAKS